MPPPPPGLVNSASASYLGFLCPEPKYPYPYQFSSPKTCELRPKTQWEWKGVWGCKWDASSVVGVGSRVHDKNSVVGYNERLVCLFVFCVEVLRPSQPNEVMSSAVSLPNHTFTGQAWSSKRLYNKYCAHSFARNWQLPFLNQRERMTVENISGSISTKDCCRLGEVEPATSWSPVKRASN